MTGRNRLQDYGRGKEDRSRRDRSVRRWNSPRDESRGRRDDKGSNNSRRWRSPRDGRSEARSESGIVVPSIVKFTSVPMLSVVV